ncbi:MAG: hypothetical protein KME10_16480 [Plectolyngbya sp. WJT66-NPBG17]|jgi:hypothetical protein|nr:hypothetical protein [Plectolyngbya sp. WJT66-NPBG17]MBW4527288.1 hypothetical protein [Phormidium tanganyikae FI6-MK23]
MTYSACNVDIHLCNEETEDDREEWDDAEYDDWITDHYSELADFYQQVSDEEEALRHDRIIRDYEFQARGGFLPGDTVMAEVEPGCWSRSTVLLVGVATFTVVAEQSTTIQVASQINAWWLD